MVNLKDINFENFVEKNYSTKTTCAESGCDDEGICRCSTIEDVKIIKVDVGAISNEIYNQFFDNSKSAKRNDKINSILFGMTDDIQRYTIDRILRINKIWEADNWSPKIVGGYYGQEFEGIFLDESIAKKLEDLIWCGIAIDTLRERVLWLLELEYSEILPELVDKNWKVIEVKKSEISIGSLSHSKKVLSKELEFYSKKKYIGIRGIVLETSGKFRLIDGYHRLSQVGDEDLIKVIRAL